MAEVGEIRAHAETAWVGEPRQGEKGISPATATARATTVTLAVEGMTCASCAMRIEKGLKKVAGVADAGVNLATERAIVAYDPAQTTLEDLLRKVDAVGYT